MDGVRNPYVPGAGRQPRLLAGRDTVLERADIAFRRLLLGRSANGQMLLGLRGVGKTVLLNRMQAQAEAHGAMTFKIEAPEGGSLPSLLTPELRRVLYSLDLSLAATQFVRSAGLALRNFASVFKVAVGEMEFGLDRTPGVADTGELEQDLPQLLVTVGLAARERDKALIIFIDEIQYLDKTELAALIVAAHELTQRELPILLVGAGLPQIAALAGEREIVRGAAARLPGNRASRHRSRYRRAARTRAGGGGRVRRGGARTHPGGDAPLSVLPAGVGLLRLGGGRRVADRHGGRRGRSPRRSSKSLDENSFACASIE